MLPGENTGCQIDPFGSPQPAVAEGAAVAPDRRLFARFGKAVACRGLVTCWQAAARCRRLRAALAAAAALPS